MAIKISAQGLEYELSQVNRAGVNYELSTEDGNHSIDVQFPLDIIEDSIPNENTSKVYVLKNYFYNINDVLEFRIERELALNHSGRPSENGLIGIIFSLKALLDEDNNNDIFSRDNASNFSEIYAFTAFDIVLSNSEKISLPPKTMGADASFADLYDEDVLFLVVNERLLENSEAFNIADYLCNLYQYGFYIANQHNLQINYNDVKLEETDEYRLIEHNYQRLDRRVINAKSSKTKNITPNSYFHTLIYKHILENNDTLTRFIILYQVVELLKDEVLKLETQKLLGNIDNLTGHSLRAKTNELSDAKLITKLFSSDYSETNSDVKKMLNKKIKTLFNDNDEAIVEAQIDGLKNNFRNWLQENPQTGDEELFVTAIVNFEKSKKTKDTFSKLVYKLRNEVVHNYSSIPISVNTNDQLKTIVDIFEYFIIELVHSYKIRDTNN